jgi:hypothetical protein
MKRWIALGVLAALVLVAVWLGPSLSPQVGPRPADPAHTPGPLARAETYVREVLDLEEEPAELRLRITAARGRVSVPGARVLLHPEGDWETVLAEARSDELGRVRFVGLRPEATYRVRVEARGYGLLFVECGASPDMECLRLDPPRSASSRVVDALTGAPVAGARVRAHDGPLELVANEPRISLGPVRCSAESDATGRWHLPDVQPFLGVMVIEAPDYATAWALGWGEGDDIRLVPSGTLEGLVLDERARPVEGARILATLLCAGEPWNDPEVLKLREDVRESLMPGGRNVLFAVREARSDGEGRFRLPGLAAGAFYRIRVLADRLTETSLGRTVRVRPREVERTVVTLRRRRSRPPGDTLRGPDSVAPRAPVGVSRSSALSADEMTRLEVPVRTPAGGPGVEWVWVWSRRTDLAGGLTLRCHSSVGQLENGVFVLRVRLPPGRQELLLQAPEYLPVSLDVELRRDEEARRLPSVTLDSGSALTLEVVSDDGSPVPGAHVRTQPGRAPELFPEYFREPGVQDGSTDESGRVRIRGLPSDREVHVLVARSDHALSRTRLESLGDGRHLRMTLHRKARLRGEVFDAEGLPVGYARVSAVSTDDPRESSLIGDDTEHTDQAGRFDLRLAPGRREVRVDPPEGDPGPSKTFVVELEPGEELTRRFVIER